MFGIGSTELLIILIVALILIGPQKLPDLMKTFGKGLSEFRRMSTDVKSTLEREIQKADELKRIEEMKNELFGDDAQKPAEAAQTPAEPAKAGEVAAQAVDAPKNVSSAQADPSGTKPATQAVPAEQPAVSQTAPGTAPQADAKPASQAQDKSHA
ncbi:MAG: twin-arginine translocase subunit TatB [Desulfovibrio sp.]|jgi:sec-independent protein translocase protein TatB|nr:twin-arginine translocase subunit TatB [Desulfovibrio sp.]MBI4959883.1 twin-arginine translocase subunit TatB [Desulfovibrio sp.]